MERDMEMSCDEKALSGRDGEEREAYAALLLSLPEKNGVRYSPCPSGKVMFHVGSGVF